MSNILTPETVRKVHTCPQCSATYIRNAAQNLPCVICETPRLVSFPPPLDLIRALAVWQYCDTCGLVRLIPGLTSGPCHFCPTGRVLTFDRDLLQELALNAEPDKRNTRATS